MTGQWVVSLSTGGFENPVFQVYGPFTDEQEAIQFAEFMTNEVDPAFVWELRSPLPSLLAWYSQEEKPAKPTGPQPPRVITLPEGVTAAQMADAIRLCRNMGLLEDTPVERQGLLIIPNGIRVITERPL